MRAWRAGAGGTDGTERGKRKRWRGRMAGTRTGTDEGERERTGSGRTTPGSRPQGGPERTGGNRTESCPGYIVIGMADGKMGARDRMEYGGRAACRVMWGTGERGGCGGCGECRRTRRVEAVVGPPCPCPSGGRQRARRLSERRSGRAAWQPVRSGTYRIAETSGRSGQSPCRQDSVSSGVRFRCACSRTASRMSSIR